MTGRRAVGILAIAVLGVGTIVSVATATRPCSPRVCSDEIAGACGSPQKTRAYRTCKRAVLKNCRRTSCTCDGSGTPCGAGAATTTTTTTAATTTTQPGSPSAAFLD